MNRRSSDDFFMQYALMLAKKGWGETGVNPLVGAVVTRGDKIVGTGYHRRIGEMHGEIVALVEAGLNARDATLYVNLEPCCCTGRTPPCIDAIMAAGIKRVVVCTNDPNPLVNGKGIRALIEHRIEVTTGILEEPAQDLNRWYFRMVVRREPYVIIKLAFSNDWCLSGFEGRYVTSEQSQRLVHSLRSRVGAIMVGINTVLNDDPQLTDRLIGRRNPARVVLDPKLRIPLEAAFLRNSARRIVITGKNSSKEKSELLTRNGTEIIMLDGEFFPPERMLQLLFEQNLGSILIEGGSILASQFLGKSLFDELLLFRTNQNARNGISMKDEIEQIMNKYNPVPTKIGEDTLYHVYRHS